MTLRITALKLSTIIIFGTLTLTVIGVVASNLILKQTFDKIDKSDPYWDFTKVMQQPFSHVKITGPVLSRVIFEPNKTACVKVSNNWDKAHRDSVFVAFVKSDTLFISFKNVPVNDPDWQTNQAQVRIFAPRLLSINGNDLKFDTQNLQQDSFSINVTGKSAVSIETLQPHLGNVIVNEGDSSKVKFYLSRDAAVKQPVDFNYMKAALKGNSVLDISNGHAKSMDLNIADGSTILLSGKSLKGIRQ